jgi:hypothetical protein
MTINRIRVTHPASKKLLSLVVLTGMLLVSACGSAGMMPAAAASASGNNNAATNQGAPAADQNNASTASSPPQANNSTSNPKCDALFLANYNIGMALATMVNLTANTDYTAYTSPNSPFYLDFKKIRSDLDTLATLPDPSAAEALVVGKPSEAITYFHQLTDLAEADIKNQGKPFVDTSPSGVKLIGIDTPWEQHAAVFGVAMENVCKNYTAPSSLFSATSAAGNQPTQPNLADDPAVKTMEASGAGMLATVSAMTTAAASDTTETPVP